jgi:mono/diheme cytochrome c family protein
MATELLPLRLANWRGGIVKTGMTLVLLGTLLVGGGVLAQRRTGPTEATRLIDSVEGVDLFMAYCAVCHGKNGKGGGPMAGSLRTAPPDLTKIAERNQGRFPFLKVQRIIAGDEPVASGHGSREMPVWGPIFSVVAWDQDLGKVRIYNLAKYIEQLQGK